jgi:hypothetical protein
MLNHLASLPTYTQIAVWIILSIMLTSMLMILMHRMILFDVRQKHNNVIGFLISVVGVLYALIMASVLVIAINHFQEARVVVEREASLVGDIVRDAQVIPQIAPRIRQLAKAYLVTVIDEEWPAQKREERPTGGSQALIEINKLISAYEPMTRREFTYFDALMKELDETYDARRDRVFRASEGIAPEVWTVTLAGGLITLCFALLFGVESQGMHLLLASMLAVSIALILALILIFDTPFAGGISVSDQPYRLVLKQIESYER